MIFSVNDHSRILKAFLKSIWPVMTLMVKQIGLLLVLRGRLILFINGRGEFVPRDQVFPSYLPFSLYCFYTKISRFMPVLTIGIVRDCFYLQKSKISIW